MNLGTQEQHSVHAGFETVSKNDTLCGVGYRWHCGGFLSHHHVRRDQLEAVVDVAVRLSIFTLGSPVSPIYQLEWPLMPTYPEIQTVAHIPVAWH